MRRTGPLGYVVAPQPDGSYLVKVINEKTTYEFNVPNRAAAFLVIETMGAAASELPQPRPVIDV